MNAQRSKAEAKIVFLGKPNYAHHGPQAAIVHAPLAPDARDAVIKKLPPAARNHLLVAKRWGVWAVYATEDWIITHGGTRRRRYPSRNRRPRRKRRRTTENPKLRTQNPKP